MNKNYEELLKCLKDVSDLRFSEAVLGWDQQVYMPPQGNEARSRQIALLAALTHEKATAPKLGKLISACHRDSSLTAEQRALVREAKRDRDRAARLPSALVRELADTSGKAFAAWLEARKKSDFSIFAPWLEKLVQLRIRQARALGVPAGGVPYDALLDLFEPGMTVKKLTPIVERTRDICQEVIREIGKSRSRINSSILKRSYAVPEQERFAVEVLKKMGFDFNAGRMDRSVHPFTTSFDIEDVRITTRFEERWLPCALFGAVHEAGHALYEQGLNQKFAGTPLGEAVSLGIHESQSRFWENQIGRSFAFWKYFFPRLKKLFPKALKDVTLEQFYAASNAVVPSMIRVEADEVTYNLHIAIRYEIEQAIFSGTVKIKDLPALWNSKMKSYMGISPRNDAEGILQDVHWSSGNFGYFPTYLLGNLYAAQWMATLRKQNPKFDSQIGRGDLLGTKTWLNERIHRHGRRYSSAELAVRVSGEELNPVHFEWYLKDKYGALYGLSWS